MLLPQCSILVMASMNRVHTLFQKHLFQKLFQDSDFPGPLVYFQDFLVLENVKIRFQDFPSFQGPAQTLYKLFYVFNFQECERIAKFLHKLEIQQA